MRHSRYTPTDEARHDGCERLPDPRDLVQHPLEHALDLPDALANAAFLRETLLRWTAAVSSALADADG